MSAAVQEKEELESVPTKGDIEQAPSVIEEGVKEKKKGPAGQAWASVS